MKRDSLSKSQSANGMGMGLTKLVPRGGFSNQPIMPKTNPVEAARREIEAWYCCWPQKDGTKCGKVAFYRVGRSGFCEDHKAEAYFVQRRYWNNRVKDIEASIRRIAGV